MCKRVPGIIFDIIPNCITRSLIGIVYFRYPNLTAPSCNLPILIKYIE